MQVEVHTKIIQHILEYMLQVAYGNMEEAKNSPNTDQDLHVDESICSSPPTVWEHLLCFIAKNMDTEAVLVLQGSESNCADEIPITWRQIYTDIQTRAMELTKLTGFPPRVLGDAPLIVGLLGHSGYHYLVTWFALTMMRWTVCSSSATSH